MRAPPPLTEEQLARVRAVRYDSPILERAGAMLLGYYTVMSFAEAQELASVIERVLADSKSHDDVFGLLRSSAR